MSSKLSRWLRLRWRGLFRRGAQETELDAEMRHHLDMLVRENIAAGMSRGEARLAALREFGGADQYREECRDSWRPAIVTGLLGDFRHAAKSLWRSPGFTLVAAITLGLGVAVNAVMFSVVRDVVLRPSTRDADLNLVSVFTGRKGANPDYRSFTHAEFEIIRESSDLFSTVAAIHYDVAAVGLPDNLRRRYVGVVSEEFFSLFDVKPFRGRFFSPDESKPNAAIPVIVAGNAYWESLGKPDDFVGSTLRINQREYTVIGIGPPGFVGLHVSIGPDVWIPLGEATQFMGRDVLDPSSTAWNIAASLQPGYSIEAAQGRLGPIEERITALAPPGDQSPRMIVVSTPSRTSFGNTAPQSDAGVLSMFSSIGMGLSMTVLVVACLNLANMFLARSASRQREMAIRLSIGASRWHVVRVLLAEGLLLALLGGAVGLFMGYWSNEYLFAISHETFESGLFSLGVYSFIDGTLIAAVLVFSFVATVAFSLGPALRITKRNVIHGLGQQSRKHGSTTSDARFFSLGNSLVMVQVGLSLALLFSAALFVRASARSGEIDFGFETGGRLVANLDYSLTEYSDQEIKQRQQDVLERASTLPGISGAVLASSVPYNFDLSFRPIYPAGGEPTAAQDREIQKIFAGYTAVSSGYFSSLGIPLLSGRDFSHAESSQSAGPAVAVIDDSLARDLFGTDQVLGRHVFNDEASAQRGTLEHAIEIIGIVRSPRNETFENNPPRRIYRPIGQVTEKNIHLHVNAGEPSAIADMLRRELQSLDPETPVLTIRPLATFVEKNINTLLVKLAGMVFGGFGGLALFLAVVGVYGVKSHMVTRRTQEIGIRIALGGRPRDVIRLIMKQGILQTCVGLGIGVSLSFFAGQALSGMLYKIDSSDAFALIGSAVILAIATLLACWIPARRATKVDPMVALRND